MRFVPYLFAAALLASPLPALASSVSAPVLIGGIVAGLAVVVGVVVANRPVGLLVAALAGAGVSLYLGIEHYNALAGGSSICSVSETINCDKVNTSTYSQIGPVPIALLGFGFYVAMAWLLLQHLRARSTANLALVVVGTGLGLAYNLFLGWASYSLGAVCPFCVSTYVLNAILLVGAVLDRRGAEPGLVNDALNGLQKDGAISLIAGLAALIVGNMVVHPGQSATEVAVAGGDTSALVAYYQQPQGPVTIEPDDPYKGAAEPKYELVEWADFQCPHCAMMFPKLKAVLDTNPDTRLYYKHYPIAQACNPNVGWEGHADACGAAAAAVCANQQSAFWPLAEKMFKNQEYLDPPSLKFLATDVGLDGDRIMNCVEDPATKAAVLQDVNAGAKAGVHGTPAVYLKGLFGDRWVHIKGGDLEINALIKAHREGAKLPDPPPYTEDH